MPLPVFRRWDIHLAGKLDDDDNGELVSLLVDCSSDRVCRSDDILESMIGGASVGGEG